MNHGIIPASLIRPDSMMAKFLPITAMLPLSKYRKGRGPGRMSFLNLSGGCAMPNDSVIFCSRYSSPGVPEASARFGIPSVHLKRFLCPDTKLDEPEQHFVAFC